MPDYCETGLHAGMAWREWTQFDVASIKFKAGSLAFFDLPSEATDDHYNYGRVGNYNDGDPWSYHTLFKPKHEFALELGADEIVTIGLYYTLTKEALNWPNMTRLSPDFCVLGDPPSGGIDYKAVTSRKYDGVHTWPSFDVPEKWDYSFAANMSSQTQPPADQCDACVIGPPPSAGCPYVTEDHEAGFNWLFTLFAGASKANIWQEKFFTNGGVLSVYRWYDSGAWELPANGESAIYSCNIEKVKVYYFNPIVNSISPRRYLESGGDFVLNGVGFAFDNAWLRAYEWGVTDWKDHVYEIQFIGREGQGTFTINTPVWPSLNWTITNTKITIPAAEMPALPKGTYEIKLIKNCVPVAIADSEAYAGDWRAAENGRMSRGSRIILVVSDATIPADPPVPFFKWAWKYDDWLYEYYAPIDVRATERFWDGRVFGVSSITRGVDDRTGLFTIGDPTVDFANQDMHFSRLLSKYICKNQMVEISYGWGQEPEAWHEAAFFGMVDDHQLQGPNFHVQLKDWLQRYFKGQQPRFVIDSETYPDAKDSALTQPIPELLGEHSLTTGASPGAIEALCIDENNDIYAMAGGPLKAVPQVYSDGTLIGAANYDLYINEDGIQCIEFDNPQGDNKITFNCQGYMFAGWNSDNGYVQNPAYIIAFYLSLLLEIPIGYIDLDAIDALAQIFEDGGWGTAGKLAITMLEGPDAILQALLYSFGVKFWQKRDGILSIGRKDISNLETDLFFHTQIETMKPPEKAFNLQQAINTLQANWNFFPAADIYAGARTVTDEASIELFGTEMGPSEPWKFPWITSGSLAKQRVLEDLLKYAYGDKRVKISIPLAYIDQIEVFDNFRLQDPYGLSWTKEGDLGRYYYVLNLTYNWQENTIDIEAADLQWLLQQYFIFGDEDAMPEEWPDARPTSYAMYGYLCDENTFKFSDGTAGKYLIDENIIDQE